MSDMGLLSYIGSGRHVRLLTRRTRDVVSGVFPKDRRIVSPPGSRPKPLNAWCSAYVQMTSSRPVLRKKYSEMMIINPE
jgi:hypothetical protein